MRKTIAMVVCLLVLLCMVTMPATAELEGWQYQQEITIHENSGQTLVDYQVFLDLTGGNFPANAKADGTDLRFTDASGKELSYWIEVFNPSAKTGKIWVKVPLIPAQGETKITMYYGNPSASPQSDGDATFEFFDDFEGTSLNTNKWNSPHKVDAGTSVSVHDGLLDFDVKSGYATTGGCIISKTSLPSADYVIETKGKFTNFYLSAFGAYAGFTNAISYDDSYYGNPTKVVSAHLYDYYSRGNYLLLRASDIGGASGTTPITIRNIWFKMKTIYTPPTYAKGIWIQLESPFDERTLEKRGTGGIAPTYVAIGIGDSDTNEHTYFDIVFVRKYIYAEPSVTFSFESSVSSITAPTPVSSVSDAGLVAEWHFDEGSGAILRDSSGNGNDGIINGATWTTGISGKALSFDGVEDYVEVPPSSWLNPQNEITVEVWVNPDNSCVRAWMNRDSMNPSFGIVGKIDTPSSNGYILGRFWTTDKMRFYPAGDSGGPKGTAADNNRFVSSAEDITANQWTHYAATFDGFAIKMFVNGVLANSFSYSGDILGTSQPLVIGRWYSNYDGYYYNGLIDEVRIYNRALSAEEIKAHYESPGASAPSSTVTSTPSSALSSTPAAETPYSTPSSGEQAKDSNLMLYGLIGAAVLVIVLIAGIRISRPKGKGRRSEPAKPQPPTTSKPPAEPLKPKAAVKPPEPPKTQRPVEPEPKVEVTKPEPVRETAPLKPESAIAITSAISYKGPTISHKIKVSNPTSEPVSDIKIRLFVPDTFLFKEPEKTIALLKPNESKTVTFEIRPTKECGDCEVSGRVTYYDYASRKTKDVDIPAKLLSIVCPVLKSLSHNSTIKRFLILLSAFNPILTSWHS